MVDAIGAVGPDGIPKGTPVAAVYITGSGGIAWSAAEVAQLRNRGVKLVLRIMQRNADLPFLSVKTLAVDIEPGAATNLTADHIVVQRANAGLETVCYCSLSDFVSLVQSVANVLPDLARQNLVKYWVADWTNDRNAAIAFIEQHVNVIGVQWRSAAEQDFSVVRSDWADQLPARKKVRVHVPKVKVHVPAPVKKVVSKVHPKVATAGGVGAVAALIEAYAQAHGVHLTPLELAELPVLLSIVGGLLAPNSKS